MSPSYLLDARTNIIKAKMTWMNKYICSQQTRGKLARRAKSTNCTLFYCLFVLACVVSTNLCEQEKQYRSVSITYPSMRRRVFNKCVWRKYGIDKCRNVFFSFIKARWSLSSSSLRRRGWGTGGTGGTGTFLWEQSVLYRKNSLSSCLWIY